MDQEKYQTTFLLAFLIQRFCIAPDGLLNGAESLFRPLTDSNL